MLGVIAMKISKVEIKNFRNFDHVVVRTAQNMVLVGANDVGKSNFIYALRLVLDKRLSISDRKLTSDDFWYGIKPWGGEIIQITIEFTDYEKDLNQRCLLDPHTDGREGFSSLTYIFEPKQAVLNPLDAKENDYHAYLYGGGNKQNKVEWSYLNNLNISYIDALRNAETELVAKRQPLKNLLSLYDVTSKSLEDAESHIQALNDVIANVPEIQNLEADIDQVLLTMKEHIHELDPVLRLLTNDAEAILRSLRILLHTNRLVAINATSLGLANLLYMALYLLDVEKREEIQQPKGTDEYELIIPAIEEPEAHLHPHVQRLLFQRFVARKQTPLILSTHSPHVASVAPLDSIVMFRKNKVSKATKITYTATLRSKLSQIEFEDLQRYLDVTRAELLFARAIMFVEGDAEEFLIPSLAKMAGFDLDRYGITVCNVRGVNFAPYVKLVGKDGLQIPFAVLTDGDKYVDLKGKAIAWAESNETIDSITLDQLKNFKSKSQVELYDEIVKLGIPHVYYYGLKRGIDLLELTDVIQTNREEIRAAYDRQDWADVIEGLAKYGIFVNTWSFEPSLIESGFAYDILEALKQCEIGPMIQKTLERDVSSNSLSEKRIEYWLDKIDDIGKGRVGQRLSANLFGDRIGPKYIIDAIQYLVNALEYESKDVPATKKPIKVEVVYWVKQSDGKNTERHQNHLDVTLPQENIPDDKIPHALSEKIKGLVEEELRKLVHQQEQ